MQSLDSGAAALRTINHVPAMLAYWSTEQRCLFANEAYREWFGRDPHEMAGITMRELLGPLYELNVPYIEGVLAGVPQQFERAITLPDGKVRHSVATYTPDVVDGAVVGFTALVADVTALHEREEALRVATELQDRTGALARVGGAELRLPSQEIFWTKEMFHILDLEPGEVPPPQRWVEFFESDALARYLAAAEELRAKGTAIDVVTPMVTAKGRRIMVRIQAESIVENGEVVKMVAAHQDVTEQRRADDARRLSDAALRAVTEAVVITDHEKRVVWVNDAFTTVTGYAREEVTGKTMHFLQGAATDPETIQEMRQAIDAHVSYVGELCNYRRDGTPFWNELTIAPIRDPRGTVTHYVGVVRDVTARHKASLEYARLQDELQQAQKLESIGRLAGGVAHDFNNMLSAILGHTEVALMRISDGEAPVEDLESIREAAHRSADLTRQLLAFARRQVVLPSVLDVNEAIARSMSMLERLIGEDITVAWHPRPDLWPVHLDPTQLDQILTNLCLNARDAIEGVGTIEIGASNETVSEAMAALHEGASPGSFVRLTVKDDGQGMDADTLAHIFEPFYTTKPQGTGTGLGLATVYGAVRQSDGFIVVESAPGEGTSFDIYLPRYTGTPVSPTPDVPWSAKDGGDETILLVEDEPSILRLTTRMLQRRGYRVLSASLPTEALRLAEAFDGAIDLLLTDVIMPRMSGRDLAAALRDKHPTLDCIYISGYPSNVIAERGLLGEDVQFLQKPCPEALMARKVREVLDRRRR